MWPGSAEAGTNEHPNATAVCTRFSSYQSRDVHDRGLFLFWPNI